MKASPLTQLTEDALMQVARNMRARTTAGRQPGRRIGGNSTLKKTQGQIDGFFSQLPFKCYLPEVASVGDRLKICPRVASRVVSGAKTGRGW